MGSCGYIPATHTVDWMGTFEPGSEVTLTFQVILENPSNPPTEIENCAEYDDGSSTGEVCTTTDIVQPPPTEATMESNPELITAADQPFEYVVTFHGNGALSGPSEAWITDVLGPDVEFDVAMGGSCSFGSCTFYTQTREMRWTGMLGPGETVRVEFWVYLSEAAVADPPASIENCAQFDDGLTTGEVCATTTVDLAVEVGD